MPRRWRFVLLMLLAAAQGAAASDCRVPSVVAASAKATPIRIGDEVRITVCGIRNFIASNETRRPTLFLGGVDTGILPSKPIDLAGIITYRLALPPEKINRPLWDALLASPTSEWTREMTLSTGFDGRALPSTAKAHLELVFCGREPMILPLRTRVQVRLGGFITLPVCNAGEILTTAETQNKKVTLYLEGNDTKLTPVAVDLDRGLMRFRLLRTADNKDVWSSAMANPFTTSWVRPMRASVGYDGKPVPSRATFQLEVVRFGSTAWFWISLGAVIVYWFLKLARRTDMLRNGVAVRPGVKQPYSLGRVQMAWWFFLILIAYVLIWLITGSYETITPSLLVLMGISAGTALGSAMIDASSEKTALRTTLLNERAVAAAPPGNAARVAQIDAELAKLDTVPTTVNFFRDIVTDDNGAVGLHRFQVIVWTIVLGINFGVSVFRDLSMPEFSTTLLTLMGISSGTYLGFKFPTKTAEETAAK